MVASPCPPDKAHTFLHTADKMLGKLSAYPLQRPHPPPPHSSQHTGKGSLWKVLVSFFMVCVFYGLCLLGVGQNQNDRGPRLLQPGKWEHFCVPEGCLRCPEKPLQRPLRRWQSRAGGFWRSGAKFLSGLSLIWFPYLLCISTGWGWPTAKGNKPRPLL